MADEMKISYVVSIFDIVDKAWRNVLTTTNKAEAEAMLADIGDKGRIETFKPRPKKRR